MVPSKRSWHPFWLGAASQKLLSFCLFCFVSVEVQISQMSNRCFWNLSNFRTLMKVFTNSVVNFVAARISVRMCWSNVCVSFTHSTLASIFSFTPNTPLSVSTFHRKEPISWSKHVSRIAFVCQFIFFGCFTHWASFAGCQLHFTGARHTLLAWMSNAISLSVLWASA